MIPFNIATHTHKKNIVVPLCATMCPDITTNFAVVVVDVRRRGEEEAAAA